MTMQPRIARPATEGALTLDVREGSGSVLHILLHQPKTSFQNQEFYSHVWQAEHVTSKLTTHSLPKAQHAEHIKWDLTCIQLKAHIKKSAEDSPGR